MSSKAKILIIDTYYPKMLELLDCTVEKSDQNFWELTYDRLMMGAGFSYNHYLKKYGYDSNLIVANNFNQVDNKFFNFKMFSWDKASYLSRIFSTSSRLFHFLPLHEELLSHIKIISPDILFIQDINLFPPVFTKQLRAMNIKLLGEIASPLPPVTFLKKFDHTISSLPNLVDFIAKQNISSSFHQLGFDERVNNRINFNAKDIDLVL